MIIKDFMGYVSCHVTLFEDCNKINIIYRVIRVIGNGKRYLLESSKALGFLVHFCRFNGKFLEISMKINFRVHTEIMDTWKLVYTKFSPLT